VILSNIKFATKQGNGNFNHRQYEEVKFRPI